MNLSKERKDFERWVLPEKYRTKGQPPPWFERYPNGEYISYAIRLQWDAWKERAKLAQKQGET